jgi:hypothetical protein
MRKQPNMANASEASATWRMRKQPNMANAIQSKEPSWAGLFFLLRLDGGGLMHLYQALECTIELRQDLNGEPRSPDSLSAISSPNTPSITLQWYRHAGLMTPISIPSTTLLGSTSPHQAL